MKRNQLAATLVGAIAAVSIIGITGAGCGGGDTPEGDKGGNTKPADGAPKSTASVDAQGSTFIQPFLTKVFDEYKTKNGFQINYTGGGSSAGIKGVTDGTIPFGASDAPMSDEELAAAKGKILNVPLVLGSIAIIYNLPDVKQPLNLDGATLANIFMAKVKKWNDPSIAALNAGVKLPDLAITIQARADGSGSTYVLSDYLSSVSPEWKAKMGKSKKLNWPESAQKWPKSDGVTNNTKQLPGSISYVELSWAKKSGLGYASIKNAAGKFVAPSAEGVTAAAAGTKLPADFRASIVNAPGDTSYPISSYVFGLIPEDLTENANGADVIKALKFVLTDGQGFAEGLDYAKLPDQVAGDCQKALDSVKTK
jgi:phosphate transport system substrate-binding protein